MKSSLAEVRARRDRLTLLIKREGYLSVGELSQRLSVSDATVRRDLKVLEHERVITRTYGGALSEYDALFMPFYQRSAQNRDLKRRIAETAAGFVETGQKVFLDAGSTVYAVAERLSELDLRATTFVTNSLPVAEVLASQEFGEVHLLGGRLLPHQLVVVGPGSSVSLSPWRFDSAFLSAEGVTSDGLWNSQDEITDFQRNVCGRAERHFFCVDGSKLGRNAPSFLMDWVNVQALITTASRAEIGQLGSNGTEFYFA